MGRSLATMLTLVAGCSFSPPTAPPGEPSSDAPVDASETTPDSPPTWVVVETITINTANATPMVSQLTLEAGVTYRLRASGIASVIDGIEGDSEYYDFASPKDNSCCEDVGIGIDDPVVDTTTTPDWGPYSTSHVYEISWLGTGATISAAYQDTVYGNNSGDLTLEILALQ
ncbi:MAG TPA: hypothetical protein VIU61_18875 [Kofleriaceae bacterium]